MQLCPFNVFFFLKRKHSFKTLLVICTELFVEIFYTYFANNALKFKWSSYKNVYRKPSKIGLRSWACDNNARDASHKSIFFDLRNHIYSNFSASLSFFSASIRFLAFSQKFKPLERFVCGWALFNFHQAFDIFS